MSEYQPLDLFCKLDANNKIIEYPIYYQYIIHRGEPVEWYTRVNEQEKPLCGQFQTINSVPKVLVLDNKPYVILEHTVQDMTLEHLFHLLPEEVTDFTDPLLKKIMSLIEHRIQKRLDDFALTKGYGLVGSSLILPPMLSAISYVDSANPTQAAEARRCRELRDQTWEVANTHTAEILQGLKPFPRSFQEVEALLPELTWE